MCEGWPSASRLSAKTPGASRDQRDFGISAAPAPVTVTATPQSID
jgi:hypothetical protein